MNTLLTVEQYAAMTQLHPDSVRRQLRSGRLRAVKKGRVWRIPSSAVHEDSRAPKTANRWAAAAKDMAAVYRESLAQNGELSAITTAPGDFHETPEDNGA